MAPRGDQNCAFLVADYAVLRAVFACLCALDATVPVAQIPFPIFLPTQHITISTSISPTSKLYMDQQSYFRYPSQWYCYSLVRLFSAKCTSKGKKTCAARAREPRSTSNVLVFPRAALGQFGSRMLVWSDLALDHSRKLRVVGRVPSRSDVEVPY